MKLYDISIKLVFQAVHKLNNRPRKYLGFKTPYEVFQQPTHHIKFFMGVALHLNPPNSNELGINKIKNIEKN